MMMWDAIYNLFVMPIQILVEMTYKLMRVVCNNKGTAIIGVSLVIQTLILPLYKRADAMQDAERNKQAEMNYWVSHIKRTFKGDERVMMLSTYYRQQNYKTWYPLKSSLSILLQVPFFLAAYNYLSHLSELNGVGFLFISDLGSPDGALAIAGIAFNVLPILMTLFNVVSGIIYTRNLPMRSKIQVYGLAAIFLLLLYNSPSGLVLYWTMNNLYSLMKNVFMKLVGKPKIRNNALKDAWSKVSARAMACLDGMNLSKNTYATEVVFLTILMGVVIPLSVISSSPTEFIIGSRSPLELVRRDFFIYAGFFMVWFSVFYALMSDNARKVFCILLSIISVVGLVDYMFFDSQFGSMNYLLVYDEYPSFNGKEYFVNTLVVLVIIALTLVMMLKKSVIMKRLMQIGVLSMAVLSVVNYSPARKALDGYYNTERISSEDKVFTLSREGENVVVLVLDRAIGAYMKYAVEDCPELLDEFDGFTYYPNTLSFGPFTNYAIPSVYGGYEYTPGNMDDRTEESLGDKQNEALTVLPLLFSENGYEVTVCDPVYANYNAYNADVSIYDGYDGIDGYSLEGVYHDKYNFSDSKKTEKALQASNFVYYPMMRIMPACIQEKLYNEGEYFSTNLTNEAATYIISEDFTDWYTELLALPDITEIDGGNEDTLLMMYNAATHEPQLTELDFTYSNLIDRDEIVSAVQDKTVNGETMLLDTEDQVSHYQTFVAVMKAIGEWLGYLKDNGVYDNTRIIIVSDHGRGLGQFDYMQLDNGVDVEWFNPLLLVKDFNATGFTTSGEFMTNADTATIAVTGLIDNPVNPFTGNLISNAEKYSGDQRITTANKFNILYNNGNVFDVSSGVSSETGLWYDVDTNIFDSSHWKPVNE